MRAKSALSLVLLLPFLRMAIPCLGAEDRSPLRLIPHPKEIRLEQGVFRLDRPLVLEVPAKYREVIGSPLCDEIKLAGLPLPEIRAVEDERSRFRLVPKIAPDRVAGIPSEGGSPEKYLISVRPDGVYCEAASSGALVFSMQTLRQLIRANRRDRGIPCVEIADWPSLRWRCFQDDMTRGPSSNLETLRFEAALGSYLKYNLMTYYMESQYAFQKHPKIGPKDGSLTADELAALVRYAKPLGVDVLGNQQSFGHFGNILKHPEYAHLSEVAGVLCPTNEASYRLLDDMYSEVCPVLPFEFFNVCCDETWGLGTGPSKERAAKIGVGGVYVEHIRRVRELVTEKYKKRMMMWGDIILQHPEHLQAIPRDVIMLTWGYGAQPSFEDQIIPFAKSGYEFFVCPGVSNWSRILPDFTTATTNIQNFVRDGAKHGAIGMLNTDWEDDGEAINAVKWHADAWAAECAWNASKTTLEDFNRRVGAVLFGEQGDHFGRAVELLAKTHALAGMRGMNNSRFWEPDFPPQQAPATVEASANRLLAVIRPAIEHLEACKREAVSNANILDAYLLGARRMELIGQRMLDGLEAAKLYQRAYDGWQTEAERGQAAEASVPHDLDESLCKIEALVRKNRDAHEVLGKQFTAIWLSESKPYALDWTTKRYEQAVQRYDGLLKRLASVRKAAEAKKRLLRPDEMGLVLPESFARRARPWEIATTPLTPGNAWVDPSATHRLGLIVSAGSADRFDLPVEVELGLADELAGKPIRAFCSVPGSDPCEIPAQLDATERPNRKRLALVIPGLIGKGSQATVQLYLGLSAAPKPLAQAVSTKDAPNGMKWIENDKVWLQLGPEGGHVYRWELKGMRNRDLTEPGESGWAGFCDLGGEHRTALHKLTCVARGPALVRYVCEEPGGLTKTISLYAGMSWIEVMLNESVGHYWEFDTPDNFAADGPSPGIYLFSNGETGPVGKRAEGVAAQRKAAGVTWGVKFNKERLAVGIATPEVAAHHCVAPGSGAGGVGIESSQPASHFVTWAGLLECEPAETMNRLARTLDLRNQPQITLHALQRHAP